MRNRALVVVALLTGGCCDDDWEAWDDDHPHHDGNGDVEDEDDSDVDDEPPAHDPVDEEPVAASFTLSVDHGAPCWTGITMLVAAGDADPRSVVDVVFARDVAVVDRLVIDTDELALVLAIGPLAEPGAVEVFVELEDGTAQFVTNLFTIDPAPPECACPT